MANYPRERLIEHAFKLIVRLDVEPAANASRVQDLLRVWRLRSPEHEAAAREAEQRWSMMGGMAGQLRERFELPPRDGKAPPAGTRRAVLSLLLLGGTAALAGPAYWYWRQPLALASYRTQTGEVLTVRLADVDNGAAAGTRLTLAARTAIRTELYRDRRIVRLEHGELHCDVARDATRPFQVVTRAGVVDVIGTAFSVSDRGGAIVVAVERGHVRFLPGDATGQLAFSAVDLLRGDALTIARGLPTVRHGIDVASIGAWRDGWLVFDNIPLVDVLASMNAYRDRPIVMGDRRVALLRVTGRFRAADSGALLAALPVILPIRTRQRADGSVELLSL